MTGKSLCYIMRNPLCVAKGMAAGVAARKLSAGRRESISGNELGAILSHGVCPTKFKPHILGFFEELPIKSVYDVAMEWNLDYDVLNFLARTLGSDGKTVEWIKEMARTRVILTNTFWQKGAKHPSS